MYKTRFDLAQALTYIKEGKIVKNIRTNKLFWYDFDDKTFCGGSEDTYWRFSSIIIKMSDLMIEEYELYEKSILLDKERTYLESVLRPFKDRVKYITKEQTLNEKYEYIDICLNSNDGCNLPYFKPSTMYKNMEVGKNYFLEELGLFKR